MSICSQCEHTNAATARFCDRCGKALPTSAVTTAVPTTSPTVPLSAAAAMPALAATAPAAMQAPAMTAQLGPAQPAPAPVAPQALNVHVTNTVAQAVAPVVVIAPQAAGPGLLARGIYFLFVGWWLSQFWIIGAWLFNATVLGLPLGLAMLNRVPQVATLKAARTQTQVVMQGGAVVVSHGQLAQQSFLIRALYFLFIGWWASLLWAEAAWFASITVLGLPLAFWMFDRVPAITTLARR